MPKVSGINIEDCEERVVICDEKIKSYKEDIILVKNNKYELVVTPYLENLIKIFQIEKLILTTIIKITSNGKKIEIFPQLFTKYEELACQDMELFMGFVECGLCNEDKYLKTCNDALILREKMKELCDWGDKINNMIEYVYIN